MSLEKFINGIPKAELHVHIEGTFEPELQLANAIGLDIDDIYLLAKNSFTASFLS